MIIDHYRKLNDLLDRRERRNGFLLFGMMIIVGLSEVIGVASIMPFIAVVANVQVIKTNQYLFFLYKQLGFVNEQSFLIFLGVWVFVMVVGSLMLKAFTQWAIARFSQMRGYTLSCRLLRGCLDQPYAWFLNRHSADLGKSILSEVGQIINSSLMPALQFVSQAVVAIFLIALVIWAEPNIAITAVTILIFSYAVIYTGLRKYLTKIGVDRLSSNRERFQIAQEALGGIKEVKVLGLEEGYIRSFSKPAARFAKRQASNQIISAMPQFLLQGIAFGGILIILLVLLSSRDGEIGNILPLLALYAFAGTRLLPAIQQVYSAMAKLRFGKPALDAFHKDMIEVEGTLSPLAIAKLDGELPHPKKFIDAIELCNIYYKYPNAQTLALNKVSFKINAKTTVALVGSTGAGKTTAVDILLGLLKPQHGELRVDGEIINNDNIRSWQLNIGYVPQFIFLSDDTVAANIAFGQPMNDIDMDSVERAAKIAELHDFIIRNLPEGYNTTVGERGVRLSGGQRQRIGIARALYRNPEVLIFDEATSSLDNLTENAVMQSIHNIGKRKTTILIAHRLSTVKNCDKIFLMENGKVRSSGSYQDLISHDLYFQKLAHVKDDQDIFLDAIS